ncbi:hypothetical protein QTO34_014170 [Cnephaeus nilssonii]|uniref:Uncharacterized protein n=1 Tax=Cnephaeus nilssonii TaxID=3371016 RepID=A0AA40HAB0_CNENI|nr:hypothetical protein QTO34_014170 [Eptesicus nilssonii]
MTEKEFRVMVMEFIYRMDEKINNLCKNQEEMKSDIATIKNTMESFNSRLQEAEDRISELEDQVQKQAQSEQQLEKKIKKQEESLRELRDNMKRSNMRIIGLPEGQEEQQGLENLFEEIMTENFPDMGKIKVMQHKADSSDGSATKRRKALTMEVKGDIIRRSEKGETPRNIGQLLGLSHMTVSRVISDQKRVLEHAKGSGPMKSTVVTEQHSGLIIEMERLLVLWLDEQHQRHIPVSLMLTQEKAKRLFEALKNEKGEGSETRANLHNLKVPGEAASGDAKAAVDFPSVLAEIITEGGYRDKQVFNVHETGLFWKHMPTCKYIAKKEKTESGHKASKERLSLLLGANAAGDFKLKPLVCPAENPRAIEGIWKGLLPVIWKSNNKAWDYCASRGLPFKVLLVLDNAPCHPADLNDFHPNVKVVYLPPSTTSILQPMGQGVLASFKAYYLRRTFAMAFRATEKDKELTLNDFWKSYNVLAAVKKHF